MTQLFLVDFRYDYTCVVYGWDQQCEATQEWILQMNVHKLPKKQHQPFYNVLVEDGSNRYAAQGRNRNANIFQKQKNVRKK